VSFASHILHTQQGIRGLRHAKPPYRNGGSRFSVGAAVKQTGALPYTISATTAASTTPQTANVKVSAGNTPSVVFTAATTTGTPAPSTYCVSVLAENGVTWSAGPGGLNKGTTCP